MKSATAAHEPVLMLRVATLPFRILDAWRDGDTLEVLSAALDLEQANAAAALSLEQALFDAAGPVSEGAPATLDASRDAAAPAQVGPDRMMLVHARRDVHHRRLAGIQAAATALHASHPILASRMDVLATELRRHHALVADYRQRHAHAVARGAEALAASVSMPLVEEGLRLASRSLHEKAMRLASSSGVPWNHRERHTSLKLLAYLVRFATKTSPNGVFCATALGAWHGAEASCEGENRIVRRELLVSVAEARKITACLAIDPALAAAVIPRANSSLRRGPDGWTFWRPASPRNADDDEVRVEARDHPVARRVLERCEAGEPLPQVIAAVARETGLDPERVAEYIAKLAQHGLVVGEVELPWSERRPLRRLAERARAAGCTTDWLATVESIERDVDALAGQAWPERRDTLDAIASRFEMLPHTRPLQVDELVRCDAATSLRVTLPGWVRHELETFLAWYGRVHATLYPAPGFIEAYARRFLARFPADTPIDALDLYHGFAGAGTASQPWGFPVPSSSAGATARLAFERVRDALAAVARRADLDGREEVALEELDWTALLESGAAPRVACGVLFQVAARDAAAVASGSCRLCLNALYQGVGLSVARLAHLHAGGAPVAEGPIARELREGGEALARAGAVVAEVSYMHGARTANAGLRPPLFRHEIELPGDRVTPGADAIPLADLTVCFESATRRFRLRSRSRDVEVIPVVSSGISPEGFVSFLITIGRQDLQPVSFLPGFDVPDVRRWPRFTLGRVVVFRRRWLLEAAELGSTAHLPALHPGRLEVVARWRRRHGLPRHVFVSTESDPKPIYVDLESPWLIELLERRLSSGEKPAPMPTPTPVPAPAAPALHITEMLPGPDEQWVTDAEGRYASEFLVHLGNAVRPDPRIAASETGHVSVGAVP